MEWYFCLWFRLNFVFDFTRCLFYDRIEPMEWYSCFFPVSCFGSFPKLSTSHSSPRWYACQFFCFRFTSCIFPALFISLFSSCSGTVVFDFFLFFVFNHLRVVYIMVGSVEWYTRRSLPISFLNPISRCLHRAHLRAGTPASSLFSDFLHVIFPRCSYRGSLRVVLFSSFFVVDHFALFIPGWLRGMIRLSLFCRVFRLVYVPALFMSWLYLCWYAYHFFLVSFVIFYISFRVSYAVIVSRL